MTKKERITKRKEAFKLMSEGYDQKQTALKVGISENTLRAWLRLLTKELEPIQKAVQSTINSINIEFESENVSIEIIKDWSVILKLFKKLEANTLKEFESS